MRGCQASCVPPTFVSCLLLRSWLDDGLERWPIYTIVVRIVHHSEGGPRIADGTGDWRGMSCFRRSVRASQADCLIPDSPLRLVRVV